MMKVYINGTECLVEDADRYLQINDINEVILKSLWDTLKSKYESYDKWFCYHNSDIPTDLLYELNAVLEDDSIEMRLTFSQDKHFDTGAVIQLTDDNFSVFAAYHDEHNPKMYWTSERIRRDISRWGIFMLVSEGQVSGYILISMWNPVQSEIFCVEASDSYSCETLIASAAKYAFDNGKGEVLYMADDNTISYKAALSIGFSVTGFYKGYMIRRTE